MESSADASAPNPHRRVGGGWPPPERQTRRMIRGLTQ
jgi:hypothetical protein